jgi:DNA-binding transcriptional LysR family regulator
MADEISYKLIGRMVEIYKHQSFDKASEILSVNKSTLQRSLKNIEKQLKYKLFDIKGDEATPTKQGEEFYNKYALSYIYSDHIFQKAIKQIQSIKEYLRISAPQEFYKLIIDFLNENLPDMSLKLDSYTPFEIIDTGPKLSSMIFENTDCVISYEPIEFSDNYRWLQKAEVRFKSKLWASAKYIGKHGELLLKDIASYSFLTNDFNLVQKIKLTDSVNNKMIELDNAPSISCDMLESNVDIAQLGGGIVLIPDFLTEQYSRNLTPVLHDSIYQEQKLYCYIKSDLTIQQARDFEKLVKYIKCW